MIQSRQANTTLGPSDHGMLVGHRVDSDGATREGSSRCSRDGRWSSRLNRGAPGVHQAKASQWLCSIRTTGGG